MTDFPGAETVTVEPASAKDENDDWAPSGPPYDIPGCLVEPVTSIEPDERGRQGVVSRYRLYAPPAAASVKHTDSVKVRGELCEVEGRPEVWPGSPLPLNTVITLRRGVG